MKSLGLRFGKIRSFVGLGVLLLLSSSAFSDTAVAPAVCLACGTNAIPKAEPLQSIPVAWEDVKAENLGNCLLPPNYVDIVKEWKRVQAITTLKTTLNAKRLAANMKVSDDTQKYLRDLKTIEPMVKDLLVIKDSAWFKNKYAPHGQVDKNFLKLAESEPFLDNVASQNFADKQGKDFQEAYGNPDRGKSSLTFKDAVNDLQKELHQPNVRKILRALDKLGISMFDPPQMAHYQEFMGFFEGKAATSPKVKNLLSGEGGVPLQSEIPLPNFSIKDNEFQKAYLENVDESMDRYLFKTPVSEDMIAPKLSAKISTGETLQVALERMLKKKQEEAAADPWGPPTNIPQNVTDIFNAATAPTKFNIFDEKVATQFFSKEIKKIDAENKKNEDQEPQLAPAVAPTNVLYNGKIIKMEAADFSQVDMVGRTFTGEVMSCQLKGLAQAEAVGIVIAQRMVAIKQAVKEENEVDAQNDVINRENVLISNGPPDDKKSKRAAKTNLINNEDTRLLGRRDFGRPSFPTSLPFMPAAEVVSRKFQFSVWNPNLPQTHSTAGLVKSPNLPEYKFPIFGPLSAQAIIDQTRALCPEIPKNSKKGSEVNTEEMKLWPGDLSRSKPIWDHMCDLALQIVQDPEGYLKRYTWNPPPQDKNHVYFYTHGPKLAFAREVDVESIRDNVIHKDLPLRYKGKGAGGSEDSCNHFRAFAPENVGLYENSKSH